MGKHKLFGFSKTRLFELLFDELDEIKSAITNPVKTTPPVVKGDESIEDIETAKSIINCQQRRMKNMEVLIIELKKSMELQRISFLEEKMGKKADNVLANINTVKEKIKYIDQFYSNQYPKYYESALLTLLLVWKYVDGVTIPESIIQMAKNKEMSNPETVQRALRLLKLNFEIGQPIMDIDPEHNKERYEKEVAWKKAMTKEGNTNEPK